ncbi:MAG: hypothetical protein BTN85_1299 [Candidatus Methanohalarchaeum thermophilum]|uniref:Uncharacterized protein n=1 Tax=Methanohalarchaeum thermophilum TaxID=1903181 RepID=A0A1Q6DWS0_METT1|nr:MAG: hypothetical protein BTN85_1299 [Candidatus Methanohalarchaeum thermophilum]
MVKIEVSSDKIIRKKTDNRGRLTLGSEYKNQKVEIAILDTKKIKKQRIEKMKNKFEENIEEITKKLWKGKGEIWLRLDKQNKLHINLVNQKTSPNPSNYEKDELLVTIKTWNDIKDLEKKDLEEKRIFEILKNNLMLNKDKYINKTTARIF